MKTLKRLSVLTVVLCMMIMSVVPVWADVKNKQPANNEEYISVENLCEWMEYTPDEVLRLSGDYTFRIFDKDENGDDVERKEKGHNFFAKYVDKYPILQLEDFLELNYELKDIEYIYKDEEFGIESHAVYRNYGINGKNGNKYPLFLSTDSFEWSNNGRIVEHNLKTSHNTPATKKQIIDGL